MIGSVRADASNKGTLLKTVPESVRACPWCMGACEAVVRPRSVRYRCARGCGYAVSFVEEDMTAAEVAEAWPQRAADLAEEGRTEG